jgi:phage terminase large subunit-like protein
MKRLEPPEDIYPIGNNRNKRIEKVNILTILANFLSIDSLA